MSVKFVDSARNSYPQNYKDNVYDLIDCVGDHEVDWVAQTSSRCLIFLGNELKKEGNDRWNYAKNSKEAQEFANLLVRVKEKGSFFCKEIADKKEDKTAKKLRCVQDPVVESSVFKTEQVPQKDRRFVNDQEGEQKRLGLQVGSPVARSFHSQMNHEDWNEETEDHKGRKENKQVSAAIYPVECLNTCMNTFNAILCINQVVFWLGLILIFVLDWVKRKREDGGGQLFVLRRKCF